MTGRLRRVMLQLMRAVRTGSEVEERYTRGVFWGSVRVLLWLVTELG